MKKIMTIVLITLGLFSLTNAHAKIYIASHPSDMTPKAGFYTGTIAYVNIGSTSTQDPTTGKWTDKHDTIHVATINEKAGSLEFAFNGDDAPIALALIGAIGKSLTVTLVKDDNNPDSLIVKTVGIGPVESDETK